MRLAKPHGRRLLNHGPGGFRRGHARERIEKRRRCAEDHPVDQHQFGDALRAESPPQFDGDPAGVGGGNRHHLRRAAVVEYGHRIVDEFSRAEVGVGGR